MSAAINDLLLATLKRAGKPMASDELLDAALGLARADEWPQARMDALTRKSVAKRLTNMEAAGAVRQVSGIFDAAARRMTPRFEPADGFDSAAPTPAAPAAVSRESQLHGYEGLDRSQLVVLLDAQTEMLSMLTSHFKTQVVFFEEIAQTRERLRNRLIAAGLGER